MNKEDEYKKELKQLFKENSMTIFSIEDLMLKNVQEYKTKLLKCTEELLLECIDEDDLVTKKKIFGVIKDLNLKISDKEKLNLH